MSRLLPIASIARAAAFAAASVVMYGTAVVDGHAHDLVVVLARGLVGRSVHDQLDLALAHHVDHVRRALLDLAHEPRLDPGLLKGLDRALRAVDREAESGEDPGD